MKNQKAWKAEDIIGLVPDTLLDTLSHETGVDYSVKKLSWKAIFKLFLFAFLNGSTVSLRILETLFKSEKFKNLFHIKNKPVKHSAIGMCLHTIDYHYFEKIFHHLTMSPQLDTVLFDRTKILARKIDTTIVTLSSKLLKVGLPDNPGRKTLKFGVEINQGFPVNIILFSKEQKYLSEDNALPLLIKEKKQKKALNIAIFDRGIQRKQNFADFEKEGIFFISRLSTQKITVLQELPIEEKETASLTILSDQRVCFTSSEGMREEDPKIELRVITGKTKDTEQEMKFLTNVFAFSATEITELYKSRWEIETFFKFIKQQLNFRHLLSRSENGIKVVMYLTMIVAILLTLYKKLNAIVGWTVAKIMFMDELESGVMHEWHFEMTPVFSRKHSMASFNSS